MARELPRLDAMLTLVRRVHGPNHADVLEPLGEAFTALKAELEAHLHKEEEVVFPAILRLARGERTPEVMAGVHELEDEHQAAGALLAAMHRVTHDFAMPDDVCNTYRGVYTGLLELEQDIHQHIHLENNVLFTRVAALVTGA